MPTIAFKVLGRSLFARRTALVMVSVIALFTALAVGGAQQGRAADMTHTMTKAMTPKELAFHDAMRELWQEHGTYTERAIVDYVSGNPDTEAVVATLLQNQVKIGNAVKPYYGAAAGKALTKLLKEHINDAVATLAAAKAGDTAATKKASAVFYANGNEVAAFLHAANPHHWSLKAMQTMMRVHLDQVVGLAVDQIEGHYAAAIKLYATYIHHLNVDMADMLSDGIIAQFPGRFR